MSAFGRELIDNREEIAHRWYEAWRSSAHPHWDVEEVPLKNALARQLTFLGEQLQDLSTSEDPRHMWKVAERLDPEKRVLERIPVQEVVQEYELALQVVRQWVEERKVEVPFAEASYFFAAIFELTAESVRRYVRRQEEMKAQDRGEYLAGIMHQLRTPLAAASLQLELLERAPAAALGTPLQRLRRQFKRIRTLVDGVLRLERFAPSEQPLRPRDLPVSSFLEGLVSDYEVAASLKGLRLEARADPSLEMTADPDLLADALGNLVQNAVKFTARGFVLVEAEALDGEVLFRVCDSGPGIPPAMKERLFKEQQPGSAGGAGIGLRIAAHAARSLGGSVAVESTSENGTTFCLRLPRVGTARGA